MVDADLARLSDTLFWVALVVYAASMALFFGHLGFRARRVGMLATLLAWGGAIVHAISVTARGLAAGRVPWGNMFEYSSLIGLLLVLTYLLVIDRRLGLRQVGGFAMGAGVLALASARFVYVPAGPLQPALNSYWLKIHVFAAITGSTLFGISFIFTVLHLMKARAERRAGSVFAGSTVGAAYVGQSTERSTGEEGMPADHVSPDAPAAGSGTRVAGIMARLPVADRLDGLAHSTIKVAFLIWTFAVLAGAVWAHEAWGRYWGWDPKETWAFVTWVIYAGYLHARATAGWKARRAAVISMIGFAAVLFTYFAVNLWIAGLHSYKNG